MSSLKFGTSGLRGPVSDLTDEACALHVRAFIAHLRASSQLGGAGAVLVGRDLRASSPRIATACLAAVACEGLTPIDCGQLPTPALALDAMNRRRPAIMVTGSHIPDDRNGLKFYRADGEIDKADEAGILTQLDAGPPRTVTAIHAQSSSALDAYIGRYTALGADLLVGRTIGVYQHSSVARDVLVTVLEALGARVVPFARAASFVPVDTEALRPEDVELAKTWAARNRVDAIVSTDGDADRPLVADETGAFVRGDLLGVLTAHWLGADVVVSPVTSTSAIETSGLFRTVLRTKVGSPYVIDGMRQSRGGITVGFEANGGVLLGSDVPGKLAALPTRDALLPIIAVLALAKTRDLTLSELVATLPRRFTASDRLKNVPAESSAPFLVRLTNDRTFAQDFIADLGTVAAIDTTDGVRIRLDGGNTIHYRASGNAPELRCYAEAADATSAEAMMRQGLDRAAAAIAGP